MVRAFTVPGEPKGKGRPRFNPMNPAAHPRTPEATLVYENLIGWEYRRQCKGSFPEKVPVMMQIKAYYTIPASAKRLIELGATEAEITSMIVDGVALDITIFAFEKCGADWYKQDEGFGKN